MKRKTPRNLRLLVQKDLESKGWIVGVVERQCGPVKRDLFGVADLLAFRGDRVNLVQVTSEEHRLEHQRKLDASGMVKLWETDFRSLFLITVTKTGEICPWASSVFGSEACWVPCTFY